MAPVRKERKCGSPPKCQTIESEELSREMDPRCNSRSGFGQQHFDRSGPTTPASWQIVANLPRGNPGLKETFPSDGGRISRRATPGACNLHGRVGWIRRDNPLRLEPGGEAFEIGVEPPGSFPAPGVTTIGFGRCCRPRRPLIAQLRNFRIRAGRDADQIRWRFGIVQALRQIKGLNARALARRWKDFARCGRHQSGVAIAAVAEIARQTCKKYWKQAERPAWS